MFNEEELQNLLLLLNRSRIEGREALALVQLQQKIGNLLTTDNNKPKVTDVKTDKKEEPKK